MDKWWILVNKIINQVLQKVIYFLISWTTISSSRRTLFHGMNSPKRTQKSYENLSGWVCTAGIRTDYLLNKSQKRYCCANSLAVIALVEYHFRRTDGRTDGRIPYGTISFLNVPVLFTTAIRWKQMS
jgi:hypothetical protein